MTTERRHLPWEALRARISSGVPSIERIAGEPSVEVFVTEGGKQIGLRVWSKADASQLPRFARVEVRSISKGGKSAVELTTDASESFAEFFGFCTGVADRVHLEKMSVADAIGDAAFSIRSLLSPPRRLAREQEVGLWGELYFLRHLVLARKGSAVAWWKGLDREEHDFVFATADLEVKTTEAEQRLHWISSQSQLKRKQGRPLTLLSIQVTEANSGASCASLFADVIGHLDAGGKTRVRKLFSESGIDPESTASTTFLLRSEPMLVPIEDDFPRPVVEGAEASRVRSIKYQIDVTGLGHELGEGLAKWMK